MRGAFDIPNIDLGDYVPSEDSVLFQRIKRNKPWAMFYVYCCQKLNKNEFDLDYIEVRNVLHLPHTASAWTWCDTLRSLGYAEKVKLHNKTIYRLKNNLFNKKFYEEACKKIGVKIVEDKNDKFI